MQLKQQQVVQWTNDKAERIIWLVCDDVTTGVVIHSDGLLKTGTLTKNLHTYILTPFIGTVNISSATNE